MRYGDATVKKRTASDQVLDDMVELFKVFVGAEFKALRAKYKIPSEYDLGVSVNHTPGGYSTTKFRITSGVVTIRREVTFDTLDSISNSSKALNECIMNICRTFAQQFGRVK